MAENQEPVKVEEQGPFIHQLQLFLVGGQQFTVNEQLVQRQRPLRLLKGLYRSSDRAVQRPPVRMRAALPGFLPVVLQGRREALSERIHRPSGSDP